MPNLSNDWGKSSTELDFEKHWLAINVHEEVLRGIELREQKPKSNETESVKIPLPSCSKCPDGASPRGRKTRKVTKKTRMKNLTKENCPLRVVELAEPSKRHCLYTWKNKGHTLPNYMVDRLRKHVMDETPVVRISEAVNYFKIRKKSSKKSSPVRSKSRSEKMRRDFNMTLSSLFAYKIAQMLSKPVNIVLNNELQNINQVVIYELNNILRRKKNGINYYKNDKILNEMAKKVTIWIANILEETSYKQLLEEVEDMEKEVGPVLDILDELLESVLVRCEVTDSLSSVLSAEKYSIGTLLSPKKAEYGSESPFDNISEDANNFKGSDYGMHLDPIKMPTETIEKNYYSDKIFPINEKFDLTAKGQVQSLLEEKINDIVNNIDNIKQDDNNVINTGEKTDSFSESNTENDVIALNQTRDDKDHFLSNKDQDYIVTEDNIVPEPDKTSEFTSKQPAEYIQEQNTEQDTTKIDSDAVVPDGFKLSTEALDEETKKVKFSNINMVNGENQKQTNKYENSFELTVDYKEPVVWKSSKDYILSHFNVAPPNPDLLSYIDEIWPEYTLPPLLKATESVSKSISSLGKIMEADETIAQSPNKKLPMENTGNEFNKQLNTEIINLTGEGGNHENIVNNNKDVEKSDKIINNNKKSTKYIQGDNRSSLEQLSKHFAINEDGRIKMRNNEDSQTKTIVSNDKLANDSQTEYNRHSSLDKLLSKTKEKPEILRSQGPMSGVKKATLQERGDVKSIKSNISIPQKRSPINESVKTAKGTSKSPVNKTANNLTVNKKIQTNFKSNLDDDDYSFERNENVQKWCMGLLNVTENLELWTTWIQNVCLNITYLKYEGKTLNKDALKNKHFKKWIDLKKNIDVDVQQWSQLRTRLRRGLKTYQSSYSMTRKAKSIQPTQNKCNCNNKSSQKKPLCSQNVFNNYYRQFY